MNAVIRIDHIKVPSGGNPPPSTLDCSKVSGDLPIASGDHTVTILVDTASVGQFSEGQELTISA